MLAHPTTRSATKRILRFCVKHRANGNFVLLRNCQHALVQIRERRAFDGGYDDEK